MNTKTVTISESKHHKKQGKEGEEFLAQLIRSLEDAKKGRIKEWK